MFWLGMFFSVIGFLVKVWLFVNQECKVLKVQILQYNFQDSVDVIIVFNDVFLVFCFFGQFLLGVVCIYSCKVCYLFDDCNEVFVKIKMVSVQFFEFSCVR